MGELIPFTNCREAFLKYHAYLILQTDQPEITKQLPVDYLPQLLGGENIYRYISNHYEKLKSKYMVE